MKRRWCPPLGRLVHIGEPPAADRRVAEVAQTAFEAVLAELRPGARAREVYAAWQAVVDEAGLVHYQRHRCGYCVGIGFPPSWTGGNTVTWLRRESDLENREGMSFHIHSWLMGTGSGDFFLSNTVLLGPDGPEVLTGTPVFAANWVSDGLRHPSGQSESRRAETVFSGFPEVLVASSESTAGRFGRAADPA